MAGGKRPVSLPADERGFKAEFGYNLRKGVAPCDRDPLGWEDARGASLGGQSIEQRVETFNWYDELFPRQISPIVALLWVAFRR